MERLWRRCFCRPWADGFLAPDRVQMSTHRLKLALISEESFLRVNRCHLMSDAHVEEPPRRIPRLDIPRALDKVDCV